MGSFLLLLLNADLKALIALLLGVHPRLLIYGQPQDPSSGLHLPSSSSTAPMHQYNVGGTCGDNALLYHGMAHFRPRLMAGGRGVGGDMALERCEHGSGWVWRTYHECGRAVDRCGHSSGWVRRTYHKCGQVAQAMQRGSRFGTV